MATSGNYAYTVNKLSLITDALIEAGVIRDDQTVDGSMYAWMSRRLNTTIKALQAKGLHLWRTKDITLLLEDGKKKYTLGPAGDRCAEDMVRAVTTVAAVATDTTINCPSTGMTVADIVGIELDDGTVWWDTVATIPGTTSITITTGLTGDDAALGNVVYAYTSLTPKPLRIHTAYVILNNNETSHTPITIIPQEEYSRLNDKDTESYPVEIHFRADRTVSELQIWPLSDNNIARIVMHADLPFETMDDTTDDLAFPDWWFEAIHLRLAHAAARSYNAPREKVKDLRVDAAVAVKEAEEYGVEDTYIELIPDTKWDA